MAESTMNSSIVWMMTVFSISAASLNSRLNASALANSSFGWLLLRLNVQNEQIQRFNAAVEDDQDADTLDQARKCQG